MTPMTIRLGALALGAAWLPSAGAAQSVYCLDVVASICGDLPVNQCMVPEDIGYVVPGECVGDVQMLFEMANEYDAQFYDEPAYNPAYDNCDPAYGQACDPGGAPQAQPVQGRYDTGYSYGGNLREGPGDVYAVVGSLPEGSWISLQASGTWSGGYQWFWVESDYGSAFHWGGLICSMDYYVDGVLSVC